MAKSGSKKVKSFDDYREDYKNSTYRSIAETKALQGMFDTAETEEQIYFVARKAQRDTKIQTDSIMKLVNMAENMAKLTKIAQISDRFSKLRDDIEAIMIARAKTREDWHEIYMYAHCGSELEHLAYEKYHS